MGGGGGGGVAEASCCPLRRAALLSALGKVKGQYVVAQMSWRPLLVVFGGPRVPGRAGHGTHRGVAQGDVVGGICYYLHMVIVFPLPWSVIFNQYRMLLFGWLCVHRSESIFSPSLAGYSRPDESNAFIAHN